MAKKDLTHTVCACCGQEVSKFPEKVMDCPFCYTPAAVHGPQTYNEKDGWQVVCPGCKVSGPSRRVLSLAIEGWNTLISGYTAFERMEYEKEERARKKREKEGKQ